MKEFRQLIPGKLPDKILMTSDTIGGVWTYMYDLCSMLEFYNIEVALATMGAPLTTGQQEEIKSLKNVTLFESDYKLEWMDNPWKDVDDSILWLHNIYNKFKPDLVHLNTFAHAAESWEVPVITVAHSDVYTWWSSVKGEKPPVEWNEYYRRTGKGIKNSDLLIAPSNAMLQMLISSYGKPKSSGIIYNGRNKEFFHKGTKSNLIFSAGRLWDEAKNIQLLIEASDKIKWQITIAGEDHHPSINGKNFNYDNVNFTGKLTRQRIASYLSSAAIFVLPAKYEPFGLSVLEAAFSGCALILGDIPSLREIWQDNAIYIDPGSEDDLVSAANSLISDPDLLNDYALKAYRHAQKYTHRVMGLRYLDTYISLLYNKSKRPMQYEYSNVLSLPAVRLEPWKRSFSSRDSNRVNMPGRNSKSI